MTKAAQKEVDETASLLQRLAELNPDLITNHQSGFFIDRLAALREPLDASKVKQRAGFRDKQGNVKMLDYVEWQTVADELDRIAPFWNHDISMPEVIGSIAVMKATITIDGVSRSGIGCGSADTEMGIKKAEHDALKRAAVKFGLARSLYMDDHDDDGAYAQQQAFPAQCKALTQNDLATEKQLGAVRAIAKNLNIDPEQICYDRTGCELAEINRKAASALIDLMKSEGEELAATEANSRDNQAAAAYVPPVTQQLPTGVSRGMPPASRPGEPAATSKQLGMLNALARERGVNADEECHRLLGCDTTGLSKRAASDMIEHFQNMPEGGLPQHSIRADAAVVMHRADAPQPASIKQGRMIGVGQIKAIEHYCAKTGNDPANIATTYSHGVGGMSEAEAEVAIQFLSSL
jgi:hypothetical protein